MFNPTGTVSLDTETAGLLPFCGDRPYAVSLCDEDGETWYCDWPIDPFTRTPSPRDEDVQWIEHVLRTAKAIELFNANFDLRMLWTIPQLRETVEWVIYNRRFREVYFMAKLCYSQEEEDGGYGLKNLARKYAGIPIEDQKALKDAVRRARQYGRKKGWKLSEYGNDPSAADYWMVKIWAQETGQPQETADLLEQYATLDAVRTRVLGEMYWTQINDPSSDPAVRKFYDVEIRAFPAVWEMQQTGMSISRERCLRDYKESCVRRDRNLVALRTATGLPDFNPGSPDQLSRYLYETLGLEVNKRTPPSFRNPDGNASTDADALREHLTHPFVQLLMNYRSADKGARDFFGKYLWMMQPHWDEGARQKGVHILHPSIRQVGPITGRTSSSDPNLQQVGDATKQYRGVNPIQARGSFCPTPGWCVYGLDWAQQEARIFADVANIPEMLNPLFAGRDVNTELCERVFGGRNNPTGIKAMASALEFGRDEPTSQEVLNAWKEMGWSSRNSSGGMYSSEALLMAERWLAAHSYSIVDAEGAVAKSPSRGRTKTILFTCFYGGGPKALMGNLYCSRDEARTFLTEMRRALPRMPIFMEELISRARQDGYIYTAFGRRIDVDPHYAYKCVDYLVQGTAADMLKKSMAEIREFLWDQGHHIGNMARQVMPIHDELLLEIHKSVVSKALLRRCRDIMQDTTGSTLRVPMLVEVNRYRYSWAEPDKKIL